MNKQFKAFLAATLALTLCASMTGCSGNNDSKAKNPEDINEKEAEQAISQFEAEYGDTSKTQSEEASESQPETVVYTQTKEILDADFNSGLIQIGNDVFQQGGYITVAELVEKYSDKYDITYKDGTYEERKEYLLAYENDPWGNYTPNLDHEYETYELLLTPKNKNETHIISAYVVNMISPDEKITLDKASVFCYKVKGKLAKGGIRAEIDTPMWSPKGFLIAGKYKDGWQFNEEQQVSTIEYDINSFVSFVEEQGIALEEGSYASMTISNMESYNKKYTKSGDTIRVYIAGEANLAGMRPFFEYKFSFNTDTDKLSTPIAADFIYALTCE